MLPLQQSNFFHSVLKYIHPRNNISTCHEVEKITMVLLKYGAVSSTLFNKCCSCFMKSQFTMNKYVYS